MRRLVCLLAVLSLGACIDEIDPRWTLDHDHVIAARATPPRVREGEQTNLDALVAHEGRAPTVENPMTAELSSPPAALARSLSQSPDGVWVLAAPADLPMDAPVPVDIVLTFPNQDSHRASLDPFKVKKTVWIGEPADNPAPPTVLVDGVEVVGDAITLPLDRDVYIEVPAPAGTRVNWLTNVGTLYQDDVARAYIHVTAEDAREGELVAVIRDDIGGVAWCVIPVHAE